MTTTTFSGVESAIHDDLLCVADTKLVLGNWFAECVTNGKSLPDFAAMLGMCTASYGQTRAIYQYLDTKGYSSKHLERGRTRDELRSAALLDEAPRDWRDFVVTTWLAESMTWAMMSAFLNNPDRTVAGIARKLGEEAYFHLKYSRGWLEIFGSDAVELAGVNQALSRRYPLAIEWFGPQSTEDAVHEAGLRDASLVAVREGFAAGILDTAEECGISGLPSGPLTFGPEWRPDARRHGAMPAALFEIVRFKDAAIAR